MGRMRGEDFTPPPSPPLRGEGGYGTGLLGGDEIRYGPGLGGGFPGFRSF